MATRKKAGALKRRPAGPPSPATKKRAAQKRFEVFGALLTAVDGGQVDAILSRLDPGDMDLIARMLCAKAEWAWLGVHYYEQAGDPVEAESARRFARLASRLARHVQKEAKAQKRFEAFGALLTAVKQVSSGGALLTTVNEARVKAVLSRLDSDDRDSLLQMMRGQVQWSERSGNPARAASARRLIRLIQKPYNRDAFRRIKRQA